MRKTWLVMAVLFAGSGTACRAEDASAAARPAAEEDIAVVHADAKDAPKDAAKDYVEAVVVHGSPSGGKNCNENSGLACQVPGLCHGGRGANCLHRLCAWMTYRPLKKPCLTDCCHKCNDCHVPPLYLYFLDKYHACAPAPGCTTYPAYGCTGCASACATCGHR